LEDVVVVVIDKPITKKLIKLLVLF